MHPAGTEFRISLSADEIFDNADPSKNVFQAINSLRLGLQADDQDAITAALEQITSAQAHLNSSLAYYGAVQNQVLEATEFAYQQELRLNTRICEIEEVDSVEAFLELNAATYQQSVALAVKAEDKPTSLFDYIA
jgi:flagellin-like hook-associated protein FlgL